MQLNVCGAMKQDVANTVGVTSFVGSAVTSVLWTRTRLSITRHHAAHQGSTESAGHEIAGQKRYCMKKTLITLQCSVRFFFTTSEHKSSEQQSKLCIITEKNEMRDWQKLVPPHSLVEAIKLS